MVGMVFEMILYDFQCLWHVFEVIWIDFGCLCGVEVDLGDVL